MSEKEDFLKVMSGMESMKTVHSEDKALLEKALVGLWLNFIKNKDDQIVEFNEEDLRS